jgi:hypothetical protein
MTGAIAIGETPVINYKLNTNYYCCKNATIFSRSIAVSCARVCMCIPTVTHCSCENVEGDGVLWHLWQFSAQSCAPLFAATILLSMQLFSITAISIPSDAMATQVVFFILVVLISLIS